MKNKSGLPPLIFKMVAVLVFLMPPLVYAETKFYSYKLKGSHNNELCSHMTKEFNENFQSPWNIGYLGLNPNPVTNGVPLDRVFDRLPGVEYNQRFTFDMLYSKYPTASEFETIHWREGRSCSPDIKNECFPVLMAQFDIDNDGQPDWVVKTAFMKGIETWESANGLGDELVIFKGDQFDPALPYTEHAFFHGQKIGEEPRYLKEALLRPFLFEGKAYIATYQYQWGKRSYHGDAKNKAAYYQVPTDEYMNILRVTQGSYYFQQEVVERGITETVCTIRMLPQEKQAKKQN